MFSILALTFHQLDVLHAKLFPLFREVLLVFALHDSREVLFAQLVYRPLLFCKFFGLFCKCLYTFNVISLFLQPLAWQREMGSEFRIICRLCKFLLLKPSLCCLLQIGMTICCPLYFLQLLQLVLTPLPSINVVIVVLLHVIVDLIQV